MMRKLNILLLSISVLIATAASSNYSSIDGLVDFLKAAEDSGIITEDQFKSLLEFASIEYHHGSGGRDGVFVAVYNQLTLLNVLYFSGTLLIIGAYSLLMNLAWEHCKSDGMSLIMTAQTLTFGLAGISLWFTSYQFLGGLLCSISTGIVPYTVYWIEKALQIWPHQEDPGVFQGFRIYVRPGWVAMEVATVIVGLTYLIIVRFPFLLAPVSFALWFLSMDVAPLIPSKYGTIFEIRRNVSLAFGLGLMSAGFIMEKLLGNDPDFGYWPHLFGLISFWFSLSMPTSIPTALKMSFYFLVNVTLVLIGSLLNRSTFHLFGTVGVSIAVGSVSLNQRDRIQNKSTLFWILKVLAAIALISHGIKGQGSVEIINALVCLIMFNIESIYFIPKGELYCLFVLMSNLGFISSVPSLNYTLSLWIVDLDYLPQIMSLISFFALSFHLPLLKYKPMKYADLKTNDYVFMVYRVLTSLLLSFMFIFLRQPWFAWIGASGIVLVAMLWKHDEQNIFLNYVMVRYVLLLFTIILSLYLHSNMLYLIACICLGLVFISLMDLSEDLKIVGCVLAVLLILISVPLQSKFIIVIGGIYIFGYLSHLAYVVFKKSIMFPLALIGLGISVIFVSFIYQLYEDELYHISMSLVPRVFTRLLTQSEGGKTQWLAIDWYPTFRAAEFSFGSLMSGSYLWIMYPGMMIHALVKSSIPYATFSCVIGMIVVMLLMLYTQFISKFSRDMTNDIKVQRLELSLNESGDGFIIQATATKPADLEQPSYISMNIYGDDFWLSMQNQFNSLAISVFRSAFLPYQLTPHFIDLSGFQKGSTTFSAVIALGTGRNGTPSLSRSMIINNARKLQGNETTMSCTLLYSNKLYVPYSPLCSYEMTVKQACNMLLENVTD